MECKSNSWKKVKLFAVISMLILLQSSCALNNEDLENDEAKNVIMQYFELSSSKDLKALNQLFYTPKLNPDESLHEREIQNIKKRQVIKIEELTDNDGKSYKEEYLVNGRGATHEIQYDHLKVYKVKFMVENYDDAIAILQSGQYEWYFYLVWDEEKQEWLIDDFGW